MIGELRITGLGVIADATLELDPGFTVVTGETGAGKTMIVSGLGLLLGQRADSGVIRTGQDTARVEGRVEVPSRLLPALDALGVEPEAGELLVARQIAATGRARCWLSGAQVPLAAVAEVMSELVTIHGQSEQLRLASPDYQRDLLDRAAGQKFLAVREAYRTQWRERGQVAAELTALTAAARERVREIDMAQYALEEIAGVDPQPGEDVELAAEAQRLHHVEDLRREAHTVVAALSGTEEQLGAGAVAALAVADRAIAALASRDPGAVGLVDSVRQARVLVEDLAAESSRYLDQIEADPQRLEVIAARRAALAGLTRKYGASVDEVMEWAAQTAARLTELQGSDDRIAELTQTQQRLDHELHDLATTMTAARTKAATTLARTLGRELAALAMPKATLQFKVEPLDALGPDGADKVELIFSANPGSPPRPLGKVASGGELSRVRLALEVVLAKEASGQTFVFDEVDAGVGGAVAVEIGRRLAALARTSQVIVVTHLAQVAAFADRHLVVGKSDDGEVTTSAVTEVSDHDRAAELARMMAGLETSAVALAHAEELLAEAGRRR